MKKTVKITLALAMSLMAGSALAADKVVLTAVSVHNPAQGQNNPTWLGWGWDAGISGAVDIGFATLGGKVHAAVLAEQSNELVVLPWDKHIAAGSDIQFDLLGKTYQRRITELAAALSDDFDRLERR